MITGYDLLCNCGFAKTVYYGTTEENNSISDNVAEAKAANGTYGSDNPAPTRFTVILPDRNNDNGTT